MFFLLIKAYTALPLSTFLLLSSPFKSAYIFTQFFTFEHFLLCFFLFCAIM